MSGVEDDDLRCAIERANAAAREAVARAMRLVTLVEHARNHLRADDDAGDASGDAPPGQR